ncbi:hypothetical protein [Sulfurimonas microaerophilic]|uniref:hypothetical protein n=1 Tax=Sulfurimonas microaerophilic TaxID=3058392 RepID=UPI002715569E|nr:hypothetical protein [Sulfurimonas sp. hsl 1-7]
MKYINIIIKFIIWFPIIMLVFIFSSKLFELLFQNKHYKLKEDLTSEDGESIREEWQNFLQKYTVQEDYQEECIKTLEYFSSFDKIVIFDSEKQNPQFVGIKYIFHILSLAHEALQHLEQVTAQDKKISYYESNKNASLDSLIDHYIKKLESKNEDKLLTKIARNEVRLRKFIVKLKKHDTLFINFYLMLYALLPMEDYFPKKKKKDKEDLKLFQDLFEFFRIGHATSNQIYKSVAIQIYSLYKHNISKADLSTKTTDTKLKEEIGKLIDYTFNTEKPYQNFTGIVQEAYVKNIIYNFPLFECDSKLTNKQIHRFKFYFLGKNSLVPKYIPKFMRKYFLNKFLDTPLSYYQKMVRIKLFGLVQKKI